MSASNPIVISDSENEADFGDSGFEYDSDKTELDDDPIALDPNVPKGTEFKGVDEVEPTVFLNEVDMLDGPIARDLSNKEFENEIAFWEDLYNDKPSDNSAVDLFYQPNRKYSKFLRMPQYEDSDDELPEEDYSEYKRQRDFKLERYVPGEKAYSILNRDSIDPFVSKMYRTEGGKVGINDLINRDKEVKRRKEEFLIASDLEISSDSDEDEAVRKARAKRARARRRRKLKTKREKRNAETFVDEATRKERAILRQKRRKLEESDSDDPFGFGSDFDSDMSIGTKNMSKLSIG